MSAEENKALAVRYFEEVWGQGNFAVEDELLASTFIDHNPTPGFTADKAGIHQFLIHFRSAFPDARYTLEELLAEGEKVVDRWTMQATHVAEFLGIPPTGKQIKITGIDILRIVDGKIVESWHQEDQLDALQQLGAIPAFPPEGNPTGGPGSATMLGKSE